jgi:hypothetical protein
MSACETVRFIDDKFGLASSEALDMDMVMWECDTRIRIPMLGGKSNCTVGALREQVKGHDVTIRSQQREGEVKGSTTASDLAKMAAAAAE